MEQDGAMMAEKRNIEVKIGDSHPSTRETPEAQSTKIEASETPAGKTPEAQSTKTLAILEACQWHDIDELRKLATSEGGLLTDELRRKAWPLLLGIIPDVSDEKPTHAHDESEAWRTLPPHKDEGQVELDVNRAFIYYPPSQSPQQTLQNKAQLSVLITAVLRQNPYLHYFQGYHDIAQVFLLVLPSTSAATAVARLSALRIRDYMLPTLSPALSQLRLIPSIIASANPALAKHLSTTQPFFALSGTLTMYAHDITSYSSITRLFDALLAQPSIFSLYVFAQIVLNREEELLDCPADEPEMLHSILSKLPKPLDLEGMIRGAEWLMWCFPPESLRGWGRISRNSVLKTALLPGQIENQTMEDGQRFFAKQVAELKREEVKKRVIGQMWMYRRPAAAVGVAVLVGILSFQMRRSQMGVWAPLWMGLR